MKVRINDIPPRGLRVHGGMDLPALMKLVKGEGDPGNRFDFTEAPEVDVIIHRASHGGLVKGKITGRYRQPCALCDDEVDRDFSLDADFMLRERPAEVSEDDEQYQDDAGVYHFTGDQVDLEPILQEVVILSLSLYWHPPTDVSGKCTVCGRDFDQADDSGEEKSATQSFGELLKKAGIKGKI